jgi:hypothetical protein
MEITATPSEHKGNKHGRSFVNSVTAALVSSYHARTNHDTLKRVPDVAGCTSLIRARLYIIAIYAPRLVAAAVAA